MQLDGFDGRTAFVTGGARGIGRTIAETLRDLGARVAVGDLSAPDIPGCMGFELDVTDEASVASAVDGVEAAAGPVDILVINAGIFVIEPFEEPSLQSWQRTLDVNLTGGFLVSRAVLPGMRERGYGRIVSIGSSAGVTGGTKSVAAYAASKAGLMTLTKSIANEYAPHGITANALAPTLIDTDMIADMRQLQDRIPVGRCGRPVEVADLVAYLASAHAGFITGAVVDINGGYLVR
ncbi:MAG: SDR family NAD(P)-dependent oxidoreductase [Candidatus Nanopelagicales bacterium]